MPRKLLLLWLAWIAAFSFAILCSWLVVKGVLRDRRVGEPVLALDVSQPTDWRQQRFRVWGKGTYRLLISSVNWDSTYVGSPLGAEIEVAVLNPRGQAVFERRYAPGATGLALPMNYGDSQLAELPLNDWPLRRWTLRARVLTADERFNTGPPVVKLYKQRYDPGMGGMMNYAMILPAGLFMVLAFAAAFSLAGAGRRVPIALTSVAALAVIAFMFA